MSAKLLARLRLISERATPQVRRPFYIGLGVGFVLALLVLLGVLNTDTFLSKPSSFEGVATSQAIWGLRPSDLLMVLPLGAFLVVLARSFIGLKAFGLFTPMLIALAFLQIGPVMGPIVLGSSVLVGMVIAPALLRLRMTRVGFLGVLISLIVLVLAAMQAMLDAELQVDAFPVVVCALVVERWWRQWEKDGPYAAARLAFNTLMIAIVIQFVMVSNLALMLIEASPLLMPLFTAFAIAMLGRYRGLRLTEISRFAPIWLERRRLAREGEAADDAAGNAAGEGAGEGAGAAAAFELPPQIDRTAPEATFLAAWERAPPLTGLWVIDSPADFHPERRKRVPQPRREPEFSGAPGFGTSGRPPRHNAWIIRTPEDV